jgi:hypothetical protein
VATDTKSSPSRKGTQAPFGPPVDHKSDSSSVQKIVTGDLPSTRVSLTFRTLRTRYRAKYTVSLFEGVLLHLADETPELTMVVDPLLAELRLILG